jgi:hypothetical protein
MHCKVGTALSSRQQPTNQSCTYICMLTVMCALTLLMPAATLRREIAVDLQPNKRDKTSSSSSNIPQDRRDHSSNIDKDKGGGENEQQREQEQEEHDDQDKERTKRKASEELCSVSAYYMTHKHSVVNLFDRSCVHSLFEGVCVCVFTIVAEVVCN